MEQLPNEIIENHLITLLTPIELLYFSLTNKSYYALSIYQLKLNKEKKNIEKQKRILILLESFEKRLLNLSNNNYLYS